MAYVPSTRTSRALPAKGVEAETRRAASRLLTALSKTGRVGCGCHEDRRPRRRWTRLIRFTLTAVLLTGHVKSRPSASP